MQWKYILFDLDGTLTDSSEGILNCICYALDSASIPIPETRLLEFVGPPLVDGFQEIIGVDELKAQELTAKYRERYNIRGLFENKPYEGIALALSRLKSQGKILAVATSKPESLSKRILQKFKLTKYFDVVVGSTLDGTRSTKQSVIEEGLHRLKVTDDIKDQVVMVGDRKYDITGAQACELDSIGVYYGFAQNGELEEAGADYVVWSVDELVRLLTAGEESESSPLMTQKLSEIPYERIDFTQVKEQIQKLIQRQKLATSGKEQFAIHKEYYQINDHVMTMCNLAVFRHSIDTVDTYYKEENDYYDQEIPAYINETVAYSTVLAQSPYRKELEDIIGPVAFKNIELEQASTDPKLIPLQQEENKLVSEYENLLASAEFDWDGESLSMAGLGKYMKSVDRITRKRAWKMMNDFMDEHSQEWDSLYDSLVHNRHQQAIELGYSNYTQLGYYRMQRNCYDQEMVENFRKQVKKYLVPLASILQDRRKERLKLDQLELCDSGIFYKEGNPAPQGTPQEILNNGLRLYRELSPETGEFMEEMMSREMFDVLGRANKRQGGYMEFLPEHRMPLVFANFNGTSGDVDVITHECGHAFQGYLAGKDEIREHWDITMETAETHSMSMEFFTNPWMKLFFGEDADRFLRMQIEDAICFIPYGCMVDEFQHVIYAHPTMTPQERHEVWQKLEQEYRPHLNQSKYSFFDKGAFWQKQHHIYSCPFYYIDYCIAEVCALEYKMIMSRDYQKAWQSYLLFCHKSASGFFTDMITAVGLDNPFEDGVIEKLVTLLERYLLL